MQSCAWTNGQYPQGGPPPSQSSQAAAQFTQYTMRNWQAETTNNSSQYTTANTGVQLSKSAFCTYGNGAHSNRQPSYLQNSAVPHRAVSSQQPAGEEDHLLRFLTTILQQSSTNTQSGNPSLPVTRGYQQDSHQIPAQNSSTHCPPSTMRANTTYCQQDTSAHCNQFVRVAGKQSVRTQGGKVVSDLQHCRNPNSLFYNMNGESINPFSANTVAAASPPQANVVYQNSLVPAAAHNRQTAHNHNHKQNGSQHFFSPSTPPPSYSMACSQSFRNRSITTNSSPSGQNVHVSSTSSQQYSIHNNGQRVNSTISSNVCNREYETAMIAKIVDDLQKSFPGGSDGCSSLYTQSRYGGKQFNSKVTMTESNQKCYNSNAFQSLTLNSGQVLPKTLHSVMSTQHSVVRQQQQNSVQNVFNVTPTVDGRGNEKKTSNASFPEKFVGSLSGASQLKQLPENISPQSNETHSSVAHSRERFEILDMLSSVKVNDSSSHSSPCRTRAIAVVQPLSHESFPGANEHTCSKTASHLSEGTATDESLSTPKELLVSPENASYSCLEKTTQPASRHSVEPQDFLQKQSCINDTASELVIDVQGDQCVAQTSQQSVASEMPVSQSSDKDKGETQTDPMGVFELCSVPTTSWTSEELTVLIQKAEKAQMELKDFPEFDCMSKLRSMVWADNWKNYLDAFKKGMYRDVINNVHKFCREHVTPDSVILSELKHSFRKQLKSYHVLKDNEVFTELPYKSSWLNTNEQLDDIDKEFGFPWFLRNRLYTFESDSRLNQDEIDSSIPAPIEPEPGDPNEGNQDSAVETMSKLTASPNNIERADSNDPYCNIEIQVLPLAEARAIFEQIQSKLSPSMSVDNQPERDMNCSLEDEESEPPNVMDATSNDTKLDNAICCIAKYMELIWGSSAASLRKCQCKHSERHENTPDMTLNEKQMAVQKEDKLCVISSDTKRQSATEEMNQAKAENIGKQVGTLWWPKLHSEISHTIDSTEDEDKPHSDKESKNISRRIIDSGQSSSIHIDDSKDDLFNFENEMPNKMPDFENNSQQAQVKWTESIQSNGSDNKETKEFSRGDTGIQSDLEVDHVQDQLKSTESTQSYTSNRRDEEIEDLSSSDRDIASQMSDSEEHCGRANLTSTNMAESSSETKEQIEISATGVLQSGEHETVQTKRKRSSSHLKCFPIFQKIKKYKIPDDVDSMPKCGKAFAFKTEHSAPKARTVELLLFGSTPQDKCVLIGSRKNNYLSPESVSDAVPSPPRVIKVNLSPLKINSTETVPYSVKQRIHEKWRKSLPLSKVGPRGKRKKWMCTFASSSGASPKKAEMVWPTNTKEQPVSSKRRRCLSLKRRRALSNRLKCREGEMKRHTVSLLRPADQTQSQAENGRHDVTPVQNKIVLKFSVLPNTFNFNDGFQGSEETNDPGPAKPCLVEGKDNSPQKTVTNARDKWLSNAEKKHCPLVKTYSIFNEYQKKFKERRRTSMDE
ncbi:uncharacterized protein si:ch211-106e7.2 [Plectropomus leopardus]|uniref:uncharacterized protein si:ch211-106e7.2 n=1 Tax=Plectropomus leopardus TaxID=160734 RepID=UPI001C4BA4F8|nr:uncharacterized protein si:ch211-106e7.2 [Plectropomus leopardus]